MADREVSLHKDSQLERRWQRESRGGGAAGGKEEEEEEQEQEQEEASVCREETLGPQGCAASSQEAVGPRFLTIWACLLFLQTCNLFQKRYAST